MITIQLIVTNIVVLSKFVARGGRPIYDPYLDPEWDTWTSDSEVLVV